MCILDCADQLPVAGHPDVARAMQAIHADFDAIMANSDNFFNAPENMDIDAPVDGQENESSDDDAEDLQVEIALIQSLYKYVYLTF
jgi:hypothetical protein